MAGIDASTAALIGAGVGAVVSLGSQLLGHRLSAARDRRNATRDRLTSVIEEAALALYRQPHDSDSPGGPEGSLAAESPGLAPLYERASRATALLQVHFGQTHPLIESYTDTLTECMKAVQEEARLLREPSAATDDAITKVGRATAEAHQAREVWMQTARYFVERDLQPGTRFRFRRVARDVRKRLWVR